MWIHEAFFYVDAGGICFVNADGTNYALSRPASQSSTLNGLLAGKAVDGISDDESSISHTMRVDYHPWWKVELAYRLWVTHVEITNKLLRGKECVEIQLSMNRIWYVDREDELFICYFDVFHSRESKGWIPNNTR